MRACQSSHPEQLLHTSKLRLPGQTKGEAGKATVLLLPRSKVTLTVFIPFPTTLLSLFLSSSGTFLGHLRTSRV